MREILGNSAIASLLPSLAYEEGVRYHLSVFSLSHGVDGIVLVYNTLTSGLVALSQSEWDAIDFKLPRFFEDSELVRYLVGHHYLVSESVDEYSRYKELYNLSRVLCQNEGITRYNILTTTGCNLRCYYCFEQGVSAFSMSRDIAESVVSYIVQSCSKKRPVHLRWFGGEPLVNAKVIDIICKGLSMNGKDFYSTMSSNGVLFTPDLVAKAVEWNLKLVRVSLDGFRKEHDIRKGFESNGSIFDSVIDNISLLADHNINVSIRLTIDSDSLDGIEELVLWLIDKYRAYKNISIYNRCVFEEFSSKSYQSNPDLVKRMFERIKQLDEILYNNGMYDMSRIAPIGFQNFYCAASDPRAVVISPQGKLCSCESVNGDTQFWGNILEGETDKGLHNSWLFCETREKCKGCRFLPVCTSFSKCSIDFFDCRLKMEYLHQWYMKNMFLSGQR